MCVVVMRVYDVGSNRVSQPCRNPTPLFSAHVVLIRLKVMILDYVGDKYTYCSPFTLLTFDNWRLKTYRIWNQVYPE